MPDFDIKHIEVLKRRILVLERVLLAGIISIIFAFYYGQQTVTWIILWLLTILYAAKGILGRQLKQKEYLAKVIEERTIELRVQRDQVLMESEKLSAALAALAEAQDELVRSERFATVGQLTKGLVDRILNPLNYINNFAGLSAELIQGLERDLRNGQTAMTKESYAETLEILRMISGNLTKISEHGANTVRIVKAMEELLKDPKGKMVPTDINNLCKANIDVVSKLFAKEIEENKIQIRLQRLTLSLLIDIHIEQMSKVLLHLFKNSLYALLKKAGKQIFTPELSVGIKKQGDQIEIKVYDNGIGIEDHIKDKIFEPFFTTKPTAEAAGIGLYISREVILNHKGSLTVRSEKDRYSEFTITIPIHQNTENQ
ncbi:MAG: HAMP domain-containing histidine kinase [Tannerellaceae bacterium]|jgi:signal transduction histidine kinase|nr:HAMP domain-containing histidine kinase [Tannerellaceae bacterium]